MSPQRVLVIEKLVMAIPDDLKGESPTGEITLDEALQYLLKYRQTADAVIQNKGTNFVYCFADFPADVSSDVSSEFTKENLLTYLIMHPQTTVAGLMTMLEYDPDLESYRNMYTPEEMKLFRSRKAVYLQQKEKCKNCDEICDEKCPDERKEIDAE